MDSSRINLTLGKPLYTITHTGFVVIYSSKYNYASDPEIMRLIVKYGKVILDDDFNAPIPFIVDGVSVLICGKKFNQQLDNLPCSLRVLQIGSVRDTFFCEFTKSLNNLPHGLEDLRVFAIEYFNAISFALGSNLHFGLITENLGYYLPSTLKYLYISSEGTLDLNILPDSIEEIYIDKLDINLEDISKIPANLKLFCGDSEDWEFRNGLKAKFTELKVKSVGLQDYWLRYDIH